MEQLRTSLHQVPHVLLIVFKNITQLSLSLSLSTYILSTYSLQITSASVQQLDAYKDTVEATKQRVDVALMSAQQFIEEVKKLHADIRTLDAISVQVYHSPMLGVHVQMYCIPYADCTLDQTRRDIKKALDVFEAAFQRLPKDH
jgi:hypothetical protein